MSGNTAARVFAIVVSYNPPPGFADRLRLIAQQVDSLIVWDNASDKPPELDFPSLVMIHHHENIGIAAALNRALSKAQALGASHAVLFDHDSIPASDMVATLLHNMADERTAICVPAIRYALDEIRCRWPQKHGVLFRFRYADAMSAAEPVDLAISSGMLLNLSHWQNLQGFDESLFIDLVDTEYCLHARANGLQVLACPATYLQHQLGEVSRRNLLGVPVYPTHHSSFRHYMINRNRWVLSRRYASRFPGWLAYEWLGAAKLAIKALLFEPRRLEKLLAMLRGNGAGLKRIMGGNRREGCDA